MSEHAELLRRAAALMRERAEAATPGPWTSGPHFQRPNCASVFAGRRTDAHYLAMYATTSNAEHIASWHPAVAARAEAKLQHGGKPEVVWSHERHPLTIARAYLDLEEER